MRYTVVWSREAEDDLTALWLSSPNRAEVTATAREIDNILRNDPQRQGVGRTARSRILIVEPFAVDFEVVIDDRLVRVVAIWQP